MLPLAWETSFLVFSRNIEIMKVGTFKPQLLARKREILSASAAAGVAVAFGAPMGGVLFSLEELSSFFPAKTMVRSFFCALVSCITLQLIDPYRGKRVLYQVSITRNWHFFEILFFAILGAFGGLSGALFIRANMYIQKLKKTAPWNKLAPVTEILVLVIGTAVVAYLNEFTRLEK